MGTRLSTDLKQDGTSVRRKTTFAWESLLSSYEDRISEAITYEFGGVTMSTTIPGMQTTKPSKKTRKARNKKNRGNANHQHSDNTKAPRREDHVVVVSPSLADCCAEEQTKNTITGEENLMHGPYSQQHKKKEEARPSSSAMEDDQRTPPLSIIDATSSPPCYLHANNGKPEVDKSERTCTTCTEGDDDEHFGDIGEDASCPSSKTNPAVSSARVNAGASKLVLLA